MWLEKENRSEVFNLGTENGNSVKEVFDTCEKVLNQNIKVEIAPRRPGDPATLFANANKAKSVLNWKPETALEHSIETAYKFEQKLQNLEKNDEHAN